MEIKPSKSEIESIFSKLRAIPTNKTCFDCNAKNPTWSSVTYGVFICIDCSAVHRNLGVHLTFVRSTQLDTKWTWVQLRQMQLGGNANAERFFAQHNCISQDATKKYNSRGAQLYRDKLHQLALKAVKNTELHLNAYTEEKIEEQEVDFFTEHDNFALDGESRLANDFKAEVKPSPEPVDRKTEWEDGPKVDFSMNEPVTERKSTIGVRKIQPKKSSLGTRKGGLGATKVKTNFAEIEKEAEMAEESRLRAQEDSVKAQALSEQEKLDREAAVRWAYKDLMSQQQKKEDELKRIDPKKAEQMERLGMGVNTQTGISHSMLSDMKIIEQEDLEKTPSDMSYLAKVRFGGENNGLESYSFGSFSMNRNASSSGSSVKDFFADLQESSEKDSWVIVNDRWSSHNEANASKEKSANASKHFENEMKAEEKEKTPTKSYDSTPTSDIAQRKFGNAKGISSSQFFDDGQKDYESQASLNRFQGSSSISSADLFGTGQTKPSNNMSFQDMPDMEDVRESVRQGVTKVAGKLSSLANGVMSSLQDKYGY